jgi:acyl carrier protein
VTTLLNEADIKNRFRTLICEDLAPISHDELADDTNLTQGILDSFALVVVFEHLEELVGRELTDDERGRETVRSLEAIARFVTRERRA